MPQYTASPAAPTPRRSSVLGSGAGTAAACAKEEHSNKIDADAIKQRKAFFITVSDRLWF
jgi:hypothetical protein